jgi:Skp family chaperone for outer membrane proteins
MGIPPLGLWIPIGALALAVAVSIASAAFAWRAAWPIGVRRLARDVSERMDALEIEWKRVQGQLAQDVENLEQLEESLERKRARAAASASRMQAVAQQQGAAVNPHDRAALTQLARQRGFKV